MPSKPSDPANSFSPNLACISEDIHMTDTHIDPETLDRIDVRYDVLIVSDIKHNGDDLKVYSRMLVTLGTYSGISDKSIVAENVINRTVQADDIEYVYGSTGPADYQSIADALNDRGIYEDDIAEAKISAVLLDDNDIAQSIDVEQDDLSPAELRGMMHAAKYVRSLGNGYLPHQIADLIERKAIQ